MAYLNRQVAKSAKDNMSTDHLLRPIPQNKPDKASRGNKTPEGKQQAIPNTVFPCTICWHTVYAVWRESLSTFRHPFVYINLNQQMENEQKDSQDCQHYPLPLSRILELLIIRYKRTVERDSVSRYLPLLAFQKLKMLSLLFVITFHNASPLNACWAP
jgi:hypothetical protein